MDRLREDAVLIIDEEDKEAGDNRESYELNARSDLRYKSATLGIPEALDVLFGGS